MSLAPPPPSFTPDDLATRIAGFHGHHYDFLLWLICNPSKPQTEGMRSLGLADLTLYSWRRDIAGYAATVDAVRAFTGDLRTVAAQTMMRGATVPLVRAMIDRGMGNGKDAQRAAERILEQNGVLKRQTELGEVDRIDLVAARIFYKARPELQAQGPVTDTTAEPTLHNESSANQP